jgi:hypothetical protein
VNNLFANCPASADPLTRAAKFVAPGIFDKTEPPNFFSPKFRAPTGASSRELSFFDSKSISFNFIL